MEDKKVSLEDVMKELKKIQELQKEDKVVVPYYPPVQIYPNCHSHCTCGWCHPRPYQPYYQPAYYVSASGTTSSANIKILN